MHGKDLGDSFFAVTDSLLATCAARLGPGLGPGLVGPGLGLGLGL
jgi:hypothetical protein